MAGAWKFAALAFAAVAACAAAGEVALLGACPGEDSSKEMRIVWHSESPSCAISYRTGNGPFLPAKCKMTRTPVEYTGMKDYCLFRAELGNLRPGTKYEYKVESGGASSAVHSFRTAGSGGAFNFLWMGDVHSTASRPAKMKMVERLLAGAESAAAKRGGIGFILFSGDGVKHGQTYSCWRQWDECRAATDYMVAAIPGNKDYYRDEGKKRWHDRWFTSARNNPPNGAPGLGATYWFLYGGVLFVGVDTLAEEGLEMDGEVRRTAVARQVEWFDRVASSQKGKFRYIVVFQHYPYFGKSGPSGYGRYEQWREVFDRHGVDFALSGDSHSYVRTKPLRGGTERADGTVYVVCPEIDSYVEEPSLVQGDGLVAKYDNNGSSYGACWFSVDRKEMTMHYLSPGGKECDSVTVKARPRTR
jgi:hypothetical protein